MIGGLGRRQASPAAVDHRRRVGKARWILVAVVALLALSAVPASAQDVPELLGADATTLSREPQVRPELLGSDPIDKPRYGDVTEGLQRIAPPSPDNQGDANVGLDLDIPRGRGDLQPDLRLSYDSGDGTSWVGTGWNLDVGSIEVDTRWGVPRYMQDKESETYVMDGDVLSPTAVRSNFADRVAERSDFTRRVDTEHEFIIRHGDKPSNYWWEVHDKNGGVRWYGGRPDNGGPNGTRSAEPGLQENAVLRTGGPDSPIYRWALSAERDSYVNVVTYDYDNVEGVAVGADGKPLGRDMYLKRIRYTGALPDSGHPEDPAYEVRFLRDDDIEPRPAARKDVDVDATGGFLRVTRDLLRRVEVRTGEPRDESECVEDGVITDKLCLRDFDELSKAYDLHYKEGAFGKSLLASVDQIGTDGKVFATNKLGYFDDVRDGAGDYDGFKDQPDLDTGDDRLDVSLLNPFGVSALGSSDTNGGDVHAYVGFSPTGPTKTVSVGGSATVSGGFTQTLLEMIDINGDQLPDKVFKEGLSTVKFRLNRFGPGGVTSFGDSGDVGGLGGIGSSFQLGVGGGVEGYIGASVAFSAGGDVTVGEDYFEDVNNDGLPDFVSAGKVRFNHLDAAGVPHFTSSSEPTRVPIGVGDEELPDVQAIDDLHQQQKADSPLQDTVRRWVAPYGGHVDIAAPVSLDPPPDTRKPKPPAYDGDGVRVAIQRGPDELWSARLPEPGDSATPTGVENVHVNPGQAVYFRVGSVNHGALDQVRWEPKITYSDIDDAGDDPPLDADGLSQRVFDAAQDFTLAGRPGMRVFMPLTGTAHLDAVLRKTRPTSDDVRVLVRRNGVAIVDRVIDDQEVFPDGLDLSRDIAVEAPRKDANGQVTSVDELTVELQISSPIDVTALDWEPRLYYTQATRDGQQVPVLDPQTGKRLIELPLPHDIDIYPRAYSSTPSRPFESPRTDDNVHLFASIVAGDSTPDDSELVMTVKQRNRLVASKRFTFSEAPPTVPKILEMGDVPLRDGEDYWIQLTIADPVAADAVVSSTVRMDSATTGAALPHTRYSTGQQGIFPLAYRGWGYAGYEASGERETQPIVESDFEFDPGQRPDQNPTGLDDEDFQNKNRQGAFPYTPQQLELLDENGTVTGREPVWRGLKENMVGAASFARSSRRGSDDPAAVPQPGAASSGGEEVRGVRKVGVSAPQASLTVGAFGLNATVTGGNSFGLLDYTDFNGDGFPDIVAPDYIKFTGPRGAFRERAAGVPVVGEDSAFSIGGGYGGSTGEISADAEGDVATAQKTAKTSGAGESASSGSDGGEGSRGSKDLFGFSLGGSFGLTAQYTNPAFELPGELSSFSPSLEREFADVNGDGLPDEINATVSGVKVKLNLGYGFSDEIQWADSGGFESGESYSGTLGATLGFSTPAKEFAGGLSYNEDVDFPRYSWVDVDGDGILDRLRKVGEDIKVAFGTGAGIGGEVDYGDFQEGSIDLLGSIADGTGIPTGQQVAQSRGRGFGGGVDFTFDIGPLCLPTPLCYIIVNPGLHFDHAVSNSVVSLTDVNGDGYPDSLSSNSDDKIQVHENARGRTNLLRTIDNPLGGQIRLNYKRQGNTVSQPFSQWALGSVEDDDRRPGDGPDVMLSTYEYKDGAYDHLERESLGYGEVLERQREFKDDGDVSDDPLQRTIDRTYHNETVFDSGLVKSEKLLGRDGKPVKETRTTWDVVDLQTGDSLDRTPPADGQGNVGLLSKAGSPQRTKVEQLFYDDAGDVGEHTANDFEYDRLGNVVKQTDRGELETTSDDLIATTTYSTCEQSSSDDLKATFGCPAQPPDGPVSPLWSPDVCPTWTSLPAHFVVRDADGKILRERDGSKDICDNGGSVELQESGSDGQVAKVSLGYDDWGNFNHVAYPANADGKRLTVDYVFDAGTHTNIARATEMRSGHEIAASATYDRRSGHITSRTDVNAKKTSYTYDSVGRVQTLRGPGQQDGGDPTISYEYHPDADYAFVIARHLDAFHEDDPIETVSFVDGRGRETQTKQDATVSSDPGQPAVKQMIVGGAVEYDALGRPVKEWYPIHEPLGTAGVYNTETADQQPTRTTYSDSDRVTKVEYPDDTQMTRDYGYGSDEDDSTQLFRTKVIGRGGKRTLIYGDVREHVHSILDGVPALRTHYDYDPLGQLVRVTENGGAVTTHTYDLLGRRTKTRTPDAGLVENRFDAAGNRVAKITPTLRQAGQQIDYQYDIDRLVHVDYPGATTHDVTYDYGDDDADGNGVARVVRVRDGARDERLSYDARGDVAQESVKIRVPRTSDFSDDILGYDTPGPTYDTRFSYDAFGRLDELTYPDGEVLHHDYDSGGLLASMEGTKGDYDYPYLDRLEYDEFGDRRLQVTGNGVRTTYAYDPDTRRLKRQATNTPSQEIQDLNYGYDAVGNVTGLQNPLPGSGGGLGGRPGSQTFAYDQYNRLTHADGTYELGPSQHRDYTYDTTYDADGNMATKKQRDVVVRAGQTTVRGATTYDLGDITYEPDRAHQIRKAGPRKYAYDADGNVTGYNSRTQRQIATYDTAGLMRTIGIPGSITKYTYDGDGELAIERDPRGNQTTFVNDWYTVRSDGAPTKHIFADGDRLAGQEVDDSDNREQRHFLHKDLQGSTNVVTDDRVLAVEHHERFPFGEDWVVEQNPPTTPYQFAGGLLDQEHGLTNLGVRWYDPRDQVFNAADPMLAEDPEEAAEDPGLLPAYTYAESSPLRLVDRGGRAPSAAGAALQGAFGGALKLRRPDARRAMAAAVAGDLLDGLRRSAQRAAAQGGAEDQPVQNGAMVPSGADNEGPAASIAEGPLPVDLAAQTEGDGGSDRLSRLWTEVDSDGDTRLDTFAGGLEAKPLIEISFTRGDDGYRLSDIQLSPGAVKQFSIAGAFKRKGVQEPQPRVSSDAAAPASHAEPTPSAEAP